MLTEALVIQELPGPGDMQNVGILPDIRGEGRERRCQMDNPYGGIIQDLVAGGSADDDIIYGTIRIQGDIQDQAAG